MAQSNPFFDVKNNPFLNTELNPFMPKNFGDMMNGYNVPTFDFGEYAEAQRKNMEALAEAQSKAFNGMKDAMDQQVGVIREMISETTDAWKALAETEAPQDKLGKQADLAKKSIERAATSMQKASDTVIKSQKEAMNILQARTGANIDAFKASLKVSK
ncbi:phasin family protein [Aestuariispira insulae]|uniref:Phasin family protein n=1 Tax=Aestuariispira insulae TaxID=1461337 RepID=A0A3D9HY12_9PROT|nr:phasin family protein [Aestuariispira insulae]RED54305.1 phasin family protein [Aestuariispira insulae]